MKVSASALSESSHPASGNRVDDASARPVDRALLAIAAVWFVAHVPFLSPALEDIDSINFALGLHHFDPALHQPHPPGYPVFIVAGRLALAIIHALAPGLSYAHADALALAIWSALGGALALVAAGAIFRELTSDAHAAPETAVWGVAILAATPLFWITGLRPMSDMFGLGVALSAQALLFRGTRDRRAFMMGAVIAGLAGGIRTQTIPLTVPVFLYAVYEQRRQGVWLLRPVVALVAGGLAWAVPLVALTGGIGGYLRALGSQAGEDFAWVDMLWAHPTPKAIAFALYDTLVLPFDNVLLGVVILVIAGAAKLWLLVFDRRALVLLAIAFTPYLFFHLLFQETANLRYATPIVPAIAYLVGRVTSPPLRYAGRSRIRTVCGAIVVAALLWYAVPAGVAYGRDAHPAFRAIADMTSAASTNAVKPAAVFSHYSLRRPLQAQPTSLPIIEPVRNYEWLAAEKYWLSGATEPVWFLGDPKRTDLALIDPQQRRTPVHYRWAVADRPALLGTRPLGVDWYRFEAPGWFAGEGWELTPETAGIARAANKRLQQQPISAYVRRRHEPMVALIAGRDLGALNDPASIFEVSIDGAVVDRWRLNPASDGIHFFHVMQLPDGVPAGPGNYATMAIAARAEQPGIATPQVAVEQFDIQPVGTVMFGFGEGWQEAEYNNSTGLAWRWTSDAATLRIMPSRDVAVRIRGESPLKYVKATPTVRIRAGSRELAVFHPDRDFDWSVKVPGDALNASAGTVTIETDKIYLPGQAEGTADARRLGLRVYGVEVEAN